MSSSESTGLNLYQEMEIACLEMSRLQQTMEEHCNEEFMQPYSSFLEKLQETWNAMQQLVQLQQHEHSNNFIEQVHCLHNELQELDILEERIRNAACHFQSIAAVALGEISTSEPTSSENQKEKEM